MDDDGEAQFEEFIQDALMTSPMLGSDEFWVSLAGKGEHDFDSELDPPPKTAHELLDEIPMGEGSPASCAPTTLWGLTWSRTLSCEELLEVQRHIFSSIARGQITLGPAWTRRTNGDDIHTREL